MSLPAPAPNQAYCTVSALEAGLLDLPLVIFLSNTTPNTKLRAPSLAFLLVHSQTQRTLVFDLGIRKDWENYPPIAARWIRETPWNPDVPQDAADSLRKGGLDPSHIDVVCLSHAHFDHIGDTAPFTSARIVMGGASASLFEPGYPADPNSPYASALLPPGRTEFLPYEAGGPIGPFPHAHDFFGDGSVYIVDAPGHLPGHVNLLARTSPDGGWVYLAGDSAHHWTLVTGEAQIAVPANGWCSHVDKGAAEQNIARIRELVGMERVRVILAHDEPWYGKNKDGPAFWPGKIESL